MAVTGSNGSAYDLSSNFKPDRADYGAMLPPEASNATLCLQPQEGTCPACMPAVSGFRETTIEGTHVNSQLRGLEFWAERVFSHSAVEEMPHQFHADLNIRPEGSIIS